MSPCELHGVEISLDEDGVISIRVFGIYACKQTTNTSDPYTAALLSCMAVDQVIVTIFKLRVTSDIYLHLSIFGGLVQHHGLMNMTSISRQVAI